MKTAKANSSSSKHSVLVAMVLGTALSALGPSAAQACTSEGTLKAINGITRYCTVCWRNAHLDPERWTDCTQEVLTRLMQRIALHDWNRALAADGDERRELVRAIDAVKKRTQRARRWTAAVVDQVADRRDSHERQLAEDREVVRKAAAQVLSSRQQQILQLSFEGWSVQEIADELDTPPERISDDKYKAIRKLRQFIAANEVG